MAPQGLPTISILPSNIYRLQDKDSPGGFRYLAAEPYLDGEFAKFNGTRHEPFNFTPMGGSIRFRPLICTYALWGVLTPHGAYV